MVCQLILWGDLQPLMTSADGDCVNNANEKSSVKYMNLFHSFLQRDANFVSSKLTRISKNLEVAWCYRLQTKRLRLNS